MNECMEHLKKHLHEHFGRDIEINSIKGVGWNPRCHVEADIVVRSRGLPLFLKALWPESQEAELHAYSCVFPLPGVRVPHFYGCFPHNESGRQWIILERVAGRCVNLKIKEEALSVFEMFGHLHGASKMAPPSMEHLPADHLTFLSTRDESEFSNRCHLLKEHAVELGIDNRVAETFDGNIAYLRESPMMWIHGDNDASNILINDDGVCLIDWEKLAWAPPALDLGQFAARTTFGQTTEYLPAYCHGYRESSGHPLSLDQASEWTQHGIHFDDVRWVCYYCERMHEDGWDRQSWYDTHLVPIIARINSMISDGVLT